MSDARKPNSADLTRWGRHHTESLQSAGLEWIPAAAPLQADREPGERDTSPGASTGSSLFEGLIQPPQVSHGSSPVPSVEERRHALEVLAQRVAGCTRCAELAATRTQTVFGVGKIDTELCFIGEAPGADEDATGEPFVGAAGQLLNRIITACGLKREEVYICNIIKCRPPGNRLPQIHEAANCREYLEKQLELIRPKFICALGACAAQNLLDTKAPIGRLRGQFHTYRGIPVHCTYHPAYLLRSPDKKKDVWEDMKKLLHQMGRPIK